MKKNKKIYFDKLYLCRDSEYGTHVTYINEYPNRIYLDFFSTYEYLEDIIDEILFYINCYKIDKKESEQNENK